MQDALLVASTSSPGLFEALGIDWKLLLEQAVAFGILVAILAKFVYPPLMKAVDNRREQIEASMKEAKASHEALEKAEIKAAELLGAARKDADDILARSHQEAAAMVAEAEVKAKQRADQIVKDARAQLDNDVAKARQALKADTVKLVAAATEQIIGEKLDARKDAELIKKSLKEERA